MGNSDEEAIKYAYKILEYCNSQLTCAKCAFVREVSDGRTICNVGFPVSWQIEVNYDDDRK